MDTDLADSSLADRRRAHDPLADELALVADGTARRRPADRMRRVLDLTLGFVAALVTLPVVLVVAIGSAWVFQAWPFFVQTRVGRDGRPFRFVKLRSLPVEIPDYIDKYALRHVSSRWSHLIRRTHVDELPQLWHVVRGEMSLVGPRPEMLPLSGRFDTRFATARVQALPGCTGFWQVSVTNDKLIGEAPEYDLFYLRNASLRLDLWILWRTVVGLLPGDRRVRFTDVPGRFCGIDPDELARCAELRLRPAWRAGDGTHVGVPTTATTTTKLPIPATTAPATSGMAAVESVGSPS